MIKSKENQHFPNWLIVRFKSSLENRNNTNFTLINFMLSLDGDTRGTLIRSCLIIQSFSHYFNRYPTEKDGLTHLTCNYVGMFSVRWYSCSAAWDDNSPCVEWWQKMRHCWALACNILMKSSEDSELWDEFSDLWLMWKLCQSLILLSHAVLNMTDLS